MVRQLGKNGKNPPAAAVMVPPKRLMSTSLHDFREGREMCHPPSLSRGQHCGFYFLAV